MAVTTTNLTMGAGSLYRGVFGAPEPATVATAISSTDWTDLGGTTDGVTLNVSLEYTNLEVDQIVDIPARRLTSREITVETNLAETTLDNLSVVLNGGTLTTGANQKDFEPADPGITGPAYSALLFEGIAPNSKTRRVVVRKVLSTDGTETAYAKDDQTVYSVTFGAHYVSSSIKPFKVSDAI